jgi:Metalloenzyme superfamily
MMKRLTLLSLLLGNGLLLIAQNAVLPMGAYTKGNTFSPLLAEVLQKVKKHLQNPVSLSPQLSREALEEWCPLEITDCPGRSTKYLIIVTLDGFRWQELFNGADSLLLSKAIRKTGDQSLSTRYGGGNPQSRRARLMPFMWHTFVREGQMLGNRQLHSEVNVANKLCISYPGYNEIFTGQPDDGHIYTNFKIKNRNTNVLDYINTCTGFKSRVASFASWDVFPSIFNEKRNCFYVNAAFEPVDNEKFRSINLSLKNARHRWGTRVRPDSLTFQYALQYLATDFPRVLHIGFGETDEYAHENDYAHYLETAHATDQMIGQLWDFIQQHPQYRNKTTLLITTDHGRGNDADTWHKHHGLVEGSDEIWLAAAGPGIPATGEQHDSPTILQQQFAQTFAHLLGLDFSCEHPVAAGVIFAKK